MASTYEKMIKKVMDNFAEGVSPLKSISQNQEIIIVQNKKIIELLDSINGNLSPRPAETEEFPPNS